MWSERLLLGVRTPRSHSRVQLPTDATSARINIDRFYTVVLTGRSVHWKPSLGMLFGNG